MLFGQYFLVRSKYKGAVWLGGCGGSWDKRYWCLPGGGTSRDGKECTDADNV